MSYNKDVDKDRQFKPTLAQQALEASRAAAPYHAKDKDLYISPYQPRLLPRAPSRLPKRDKDSSSYDASGRKTV